MTTHFSDASAASDKQRAAVFEKARQLSSLASGPQQQASNIPQPTQHMLWNNNKEDETPSERFCYEAKDYEMATPGRNKRFGVADFSSLPRPKNNVGSVSTMTSTNVSVAHTPTKMTISYKDSKRVPIVANVLQKTLTFKEFRRYLSIPSKHRKQFFFKTNCEDGTAPYQLLLVNDDSAILPTFDGKITAECRSQSDSE